MYVTDLQGNTEPLNHIQRTEINEEVNGAFTLSLTSFFHANNPGHELIEEEAIITADGYSFRVKQMRESKSRKEITATSTFFDLTGKRRDAIYGGTRTFGEFAAFVFSDTGWAFQVIDVSGSQLIPNFGEDNVIKLVNQMCVAFECEYKILPNNVIQFAMRVGGDYDAQYRYGHNVQSLSKSIDTTNLRTFIQGYGADNLVVSYTSPLADTYGIIEADPVHDDRFTIGENLVEYVRKQLTDYPEVTMELDSVELSDKELGERVWLIYEPMNIEFQTRILAKRSTLRGDNWVTQSVTIGNAQRKTLSDILSSANIKIDENAKQTRSRFEQTNDRITLEVERIDDSLASIIVEADNIQLAVTDLGDRMVTNEATISIHSNEIQSKVSQTDYNGNTIASLINQTATTIDIQASKINLVGAVEVLSDISGKLGTITAGNIDIYESAKIGAGLYLRGEGLYTGVYFGNTQIVQDTTGYLNLLNRVRIGNFVEINGQLDLTGSNVTWGNNRPTATWG